MNQFVNRDVELDSLRAAFAAPGASLYVLYGRRRLGKTTLLRRFADGREGVYYMADRSTERDAIRMLARAMATAMNETTLETADFQDWYALFAAFDRLRPERKTYLILDEFQYLCQVQPAFASIVQKWWDEHWSRSNLMVVLCGSVMSLMYKETLSHASPLYGRRTGQWLLRPLRFSHMARFFQRFAPRERLEMWALTGGVPRYAELCADCAGFDDALGRLALTKDGPLYSEARFLLQDEVSVPNVYWSLLCAIGGGVMRISEIAGRLGLPANQLTRYLRALQDLGLIRRDVPVTETNPEKSKKGLYVMDDAYLRLWFGAIAPFESLLEFGQTSDVLARVRPRLVAHQAWAFEQVCRQYVEDRSGEFGCSRIGRFWDRHMEIDVAGVDRDGTMVLAGECKWTASPLGADVLRRLEAKVAAKWTNSAERTKLLVFSSGGFQAAARKEADRKGARLVDGRDLVGE